jgi:hypothetical protein
MVGTRFVAGGGDRVLALTRLARVARLVAMPETRAAIVAAAESPTLRDLAHRAVNDRAGLIRELRDPANARELVRSAARHPASRELVSAGLLFLPARYIPLGWALTKASGRVLRRYVDPPAEVLEPTAMGARRPLRNVGPETP